MRRYEKAHLLRYKEALRKGATMRRYETTRPNGVTIMRYHLALTSQRSERCFVTVYGSGVS